MIKLDDYGERSSLNGKAKAYAFIKINPSKQVDIKNVDGELKKLGEHFEIINPGDAFGLDRIIFQDKKSLAMMKVRSMSKGWLFEFHGQKSEKFLYNYFEEIIELIKQNNLLNQYTIKPEIEQTCYESNVKKKIEQEKKFSGISLDFLI